VSIWAASKVRTVSWFGDFIKNSELFGCFSSRFRRLSAKLVIMDNSREHEARHPTRMLSNLQEWTGIAIARRRPCSPTRVAVHYCRCSPQLPNVRTTRLELGSNSRSFPL
jgi:hypothetical protein